MNTKKLNACGSNSCVCLTLWHCLLFVVLASSGCAQWDMHKGIPWGVDDIGGKDEQPMKMVPFWVETVMHRDDCSPKRGFGGRLFFYGQKEGKPIKVEGSLVVYGFVENGREPGNNKPDKKFVFTAEQFAKHYKKGDAGHSYDFWIPWDDANGPQQEVSLICRFTPKNGSLIVSEQTRHQLSGALVQSPTPHQSPIPQNGNGGATAAGGAVAAAGPTTQGVVQQASFQQAAPLSPPAAGVGLQTTTIDLPSGFGRTTGTDPLRALATAAPSPLPQFSAIPAQSMMPPQVNLPPQLPVANLPATGGIAAVPGVVTPGWPTNAGPAPQPRLQTLGGPITRLQRGSNPFLPATQADPTNRTPAATGINSPSALH